MNNNDPYQSWLEKNRNIEVSPDFSCEVMSRIYRYEQERGEGTARKPDLLHGWLEWISLHPAARAALIVAGLLLGVARLIASLQIILSF
jgi:hypothetical protein